MMVATTSAVMVWQPCHNRWQWCSLWPEISWVFCPVARRKAILTERPWKFRPRCLTMVPAPDNKMAADAAEMVGKNGMLL